MSRVATSWSGTSISHRITLDEAPEMYKIWRDKKDNVTKIVIDPRGEKAA
jgi:threonine dehydrogenase-like Zn-dependent dehydrogenase